MKKIIENVKALFRKMYDVGLWTSKLDVVFFVGVIVLISTILMNIVGFLFVSFFTGFRVTFILNDMQPMQKGLFWFFILHTGFVTAVITAVFVQLFERIIFDPVRDIKVELSNLMRSELSDYFVSGKMSKPFRDPDSSITWEDQVRYFVDAASVEKYMDELTGCFNRKYFQYKLTSYMELQKLSNGVSSGDSVKKYGADCYAVFMIDIDHFKWINDDYGHATGDVVLRSVGKLLRDVVGDNGVVVRNGGEEFVIVYCAGYPFDFSTVAEKINQAFRDNVRVHSSGSLKGRDVTCSIGFVSYPFYPGAEGVLTLENHVDLADMAMYASKESGRDMWHELVSDRAPTDKVDMVLYASNAEYGIKRGYYHLKNKHDKN